MNLNNIFRQIARENNTTPQEVRKEIENAIDEAMKNPDPKVRAYWENIPRKGEKPTPEEFISYCTNEIKRKRDLS